MVTDNRVIFKSDQNRYSLTYLNFDFSRFTIGHAPISETGVKGFKNRYLFTQLLNGGFNLNLRQAVSDRNQRNSVL